jgi:uncharacterized membrane protein
MTQPSTAVIHFYRAATAHADVWRQRLDITTNWAVVTNAAILSFGLSAPSTPHFVLLLVLVIDLFFLLMESRRYQVYDLWHHRLRLMHQYIFAEALANEPKASDEEVRAKLGELADHLGHTVPRISLIDAIGFRIRRNYFYILLFTVGAWLLKLDIHPHRPASFAAFIARAEMGPLNGYVVFISVLVMMLIALILAIRAPSESMVNWLRRPSPLGRILRSRWLRRPATTDEIEGHPAQKPPSPSEKPPGDAPPED